MHRELLRLHFEGSVLKCRDGRYRPGERSSLWRKVNVQRIDTLSAVALCIEVGGFRTSIAPRD